MKRSRSPTTPVTASPPPSGARTSTAPSKSPPASRPASSGSIPPTCSTRRPASAAIAKAASAAKAGARACAEYSRRGSGEGQALSEGGGAERLARNRALRRMRARSTARPKCMSAASRRVRIPATVTPCSTRRVVRSGMRVSATARTSATPSRPHRKRPAGARRPRITARRCSITSPRTSRRAADEFARRLSAMTGASSRAAQAEVDASIRRAFYYAGFADKYDGAVHATQTRFVTMAMNEPWGVMGIVCPDEAPLLALRLTRDASDRDGQRGGRRSLRGASA